MEMIKKSIALVSFCLLSFQLLYAQTDVRKMINEIKLDSTYYKAEVSDSIESEAIRLATQDLVYSINADRLTLGQNPVSLEILNPALQSLTYRRGDIKRVLVFIEIAVVDSIIQSSSREETKATFPSAAIIMQLSEIEMADEAVKILQQGKESGSVADMGQLHSFADIPAEAYLLVYDRQRSIRALLSPSTDEGYINIKRNCPDQLSNYRGCGALWFK